MTRQQTTISRANRQDIELVTVENPFAQAEISLFGGQVLSFRPAADKHRNLLWVSPGSSWDKSRPVRGGIPVCWPWFGQAEDSSLPSHGFVRNCMWNLVNVEEEDHATILLLEPESTSGPGFNKNTGLELRVSIGRELALSLTTLNYGTEPVLITCALHSYFSVSDISDVEITGLTGSYSDKTRHWTIHDTPATYRITEETDRIHQLPAPEVIINDSGLIRKTSIRSAGHDSVVVWNPWEKGASMPDMESDSFRDMVCIESAVTRGAKLQPGSMHHLVQVISSSAS